MLSFFESILSKFGVKSLNKKIKQQPLPGEKWGNISNLARISLKKQGDPWATENEEKPVIGHTVTILDVKDGWVRFAWNGTSLFQDERQELSVFLYLYQRLDEIDVLKYDLKQITPTREALDKINYAGAQRP